MPANVSGASCRAAWFLGCVSVVCAATPAFAQAQIEVHGGVSTTTGSERTGVAALAWVPELHRTGHGSVRLELGAMYFDGREVRDRNLSDDVTVGYVGVRYERDNGFIAGAAVGAQSGETDALSGDPQFLTSLGWRWGRFSLIGRHVSNATLHEPNDGETMLLAGWRF